MLTSVVTFYDNETGPSSTTPLLFPPPSSAVSNRKSGIRNPNNRRISNHFHFSNRKYSAVFHNESASHSPLLTRHCPSNRDTAIKTPDKLLHFNHFQFSNRDKCAFCMSDKSAGTPLSDPTYPNCSPVARHSSLVTRIASVANLCDNGWLKLRLT
jgi:hypothetical protein